MNQPARGLWGAPGGLLAGFPASDEDRALLISAAATVTQEWTSPSLTPWLEDVRSLWPEVARMREEMGPQRMQTDANLLNLARAGVAAAWLLARETAWLQAFCAPTDPVAADFAPAAMLQAGATVWQRRITRLDALAQGYLRHPDLPQAAMRAQALQTASVRLFHAVTLAKTGGAAQPVPLAEARQRVDRAYATLRDVVVAHRCLTAPTLCRVFPDLSPAWRWDRLHISNTSLESIGV